MAVFYFMELQHYTGDDVMFNNYDGTDWTPLEADSLDDALEQVLIEMRLYHPNVKRWEKMNYRDSRNDEQLVDIWVESPHADHYLQLGDVAQDSIWLFAIADGPTYNARWR